MGEFQKGAAPRKKTQVMTNFCVMDTNDHKLQGVGYATCFCQYTNTNIRKLDVYTFTSLVFYHDSKDKPLCKWELQRIVPNQGKNNLIGGGSLLDHHSKDAATPPEIGEHIDLPKYFHHITCNAKMR